MWAEHLELMVSPENGKTLELTNNSVVEDGRIKNGTLIEPESGRQYPIVNFIPRFVSSENYAEGFGYQWNLHRRTQYDDASGFPVSRERFTNETRWGSNLSGEVILEAGCGSGRFTPHALETGAIVVSFDYSNAVEANFASNGENKNLLLLQADIYRMPFRENYFDRAYCFGVLQHTPNPRGAFMEIVKRLKPGGWLSSDVYLKSLSKLLFATKYKVRPFMVGKKPEELYSQVKRYIDFMWPIAGMIRKLPKGKSVNWLLLVADYSKLLPGADDKTLKEWAYLDTFDMLAPQYDNPQTPQTFRRWHEEAGLKEIDVHLGYNGVEGRARKPN